MLPCRINASKYRASPDWNFGTKKDLFGESQATGSEKRKQDLLS